MDLVFADSLYWFLSLYHVKLIILGISVSLAVFISLFHILRKWGDTNVF